MKLPAYSILLIQFFIACNGNVQEAKTESDTTVNRNAIENGKYISQDRLNEYVQQSPSTVVDKPESEPFDSIRFDKIIACDYDGTDERGSGIIDSAGNFDSRIKAQRALDTGQINSITSCLGSRHSYGDGTAPCFRPGMALVFFQNIQPVMKIEICLDCNFLESSVRIPAKYGKKTNLEGSEIELTGFSKDGRKCIIDLAKQLAFSYAKEKIDY
jgi:hypothetical protein